MSDIVNNLQNSMTVGYTADTISTASSTDAAVREKIVDTHEPADVKSWLRLSDEHVNSRKTWHLGAVELDYHQVVELLIL